MNGILTFLLIAFTSGDEVLPVPNRPMPNPAMARTNSPPVMPGGATGPVGFLANTQPPVLPSMRNGTTPSGLGSTYETGWGTDKDGLFCLILQISPDAIAMFAQGASGQELPVDIPPVVRNRVERVIVRVGTGPVEKDPPDLRMSATPTSATPFLANLDNRNTFDNRTPVNIDRATEVTTTSGGSNMVGPGAASGGGQPVLPNSNVNPNVGRLASTNNQSNSVLPGRNNDPFPGMNSNGINNSSATDDRFNSTSSFGTSGKSVWDPLRNNPTNTASTYANPGYPTGSNNPAMGMGMNNPNNNYPGRAGSSAYLAQNPNANLGQGGPNDPASLSGVFPGNNYQPGNNYLPNNNGQPGNNGVGTYQPPMPGTNPTPGYGYGNQNAPGSAGYAPLGPSTSAAGNGFGVSNRGFGGPSMRTAGIPAGQSNGNTSQFDTTVGSGDAPRTAQWLPFVLLVSIVGNLYLALWMGHLRSKYRQLLSNMRGVPIPE